MFSLPLSGYRCVGDFATVFFLRPNRTVTGFVAPSVSTFSAARFALFDRGVTSRRKLPTATFRRLPRLHELDGVSSAVPMAATSTSGFFFLRLARVLVRFGLAFLAIRTACLELQHVRSGERSGSREGKGLRQCVATTGCNQERLHATQSREEARLQQGGQRTLRLEVTNIRRVNDAVAPIAGARHTVCCLRFSAVQVALMRAGIARRSGKPQRQYE